MYAKRDAGKHGEMSGDYGIKNIKYVRVFTTDSQQHFPIPPLDRAYIHDLKSEVDTKSQSRHELAPVLQSRKDIREEIGI